MTFGRDQVNGCIKRTFHRRGAPALPRLPEKYGRQRSGFFTRHRMPRFFYQCLLNG